MTVAYLQPAHDVVDGELYVLGQQVEVPAAAVVQHLAGEEEARAGDGAARAELHARVVQKLRLAQEPQRVAGGDPVVPEVLGVAVARDDAVALGEDAVHLLYVVLLEDVVRVEDEVAVEGALGEELVNAAQQVAQGVALADLRGVEALEDYGAALGRHPGRLIRAVVRDDEGRDEARVVALAPDALEQLADDRLLVPRRDQHGVAVRPRGSPAPVLHQEGHEDVDELVGIADDEYYRYYKIYGLHSFHGSCPSHLPVL